MYDLTQPGDKTSENIPSIETLPHAANISAFP